MRHDIPEPRSKKKYVLKLILIIIVWFALYSPVYFSFMELKQQIPDPISLRFAHEKATLFQPSGLEKVAKSP